VRALVSLRKRPHHLVHPTRRRIRAHVLPPEYPGKAAVLGGAGDRALQSLARRVHGQGEESVQEAQHGQQRRDHCAGAVGRRRRQVQDLDGLLQVRAREELGRVVHQVVSGRQGVSHARSLQLAERAESGDRGQAADSHEIRNSVFYHLGNTGMHLSFLLLKPIHCVL
jgi:hypothetical protein